MKTAKDWMKEFLPALDAAMSCPDVSPMETVEMYIERAIAHERAECAELAEWHGCHHYGCAEDIAKKIRARA